jgi:hypothetical protein
MNPCSPDRDGTPLSWGDDPELAELHQEIRDAGNRLQVIGGRWSDLPSGCALGPEGCLIELLVGLLCLPLGASYVTVCRARLRRRLARLPVERRPDALRLLESEMHGDASLIVKPLIRRLRAPTELAPGAPPEGRGDETSPAGE